MIFPIVTITAEDFEQLQIKENKIYIVKYPTRCDLWFRDSVISFGGIANKGILDITQEDNTLKVLYDDNSIDEIPIAFKTELPTFTNNVLKFGNKLSIDLSYLATPTTNDGSDRNAIPTVGAVVKLVDDYLMKMGLFEEFEVIINNYALVGNDLVIDTSDIYDITSENKDLESLDNSLTISDLRPMTNDEIAQISGQKGKGRYRSDSIVEVIAGTSEVFEFIKWEVVNDNIVLDDLNNTTNILNITNESIELNAIWRLPTVNVTMDENNNIIVSSGFEKEYNSDNDGNIVVTIKAPLDNIFSSDEINLPNNWNYKVEKDDNNNFVITITPPSIFTVDITNFILNDDANEIEIESVPNGQIGAGKYFANTLVKVVAASFDENGITEIETTDDIIEVKFAEWQIEDGNIDDYNLVDSTNTFTIENNIKLKAIFIPVIEEEE